MTMFGKIMGRGAESPDVTGAAGNVAGPGGSGGEDSRAGSAAVRLDNVSIVYQLQRSKQAHCAVQGVSLTVTPGEFVALVGPSGCGKSSLLGAISGLVQYEGNLWSQGRMVKGPTPASSMVFQAAALFPWRTVSANVAYGLQLRGEKKERIRRRVEEMLRLVGLEKMSHAYPHEMSGGMQQRVNLARALAVDPDILLLDEPFAALDAQTREEMQDELLRIWQETKKTSILVTHQIDEALLLADRVIVMSRGPRSRILEVIDVHFERPRTDAVRTDPTFVAMSQQISALLKEERHRARSAE